MWSVFLTVFLCACAAFTPVAAATEPPSPIDGAMQFPAIQGADGPEEFVWEVSLAPDQELRQIDDRSAGVYYTDPGTSLAFSITAVAAHDAIGTAVPTTLAVTQPNLVTLTVHHRDGNPAASGAPFNYPVVSGEGWEGGFHTTFIAMPAEEAAPAPTCTVPDLDGRTLRTSRKLLHRSHCKLGRVRGERNRAAHVVQQYRLAGKSLPDWTPVDVKVS
jgi:hypothetical protein